jgi:SPP1 gp7 family putative phage head morphogenesis protein
VTAPTQPATQPQQDQNDQQDQKNRRNPAEDAVIAALVAWFLVSAGASALSLPADLVARMVSLGLSARAVGAAAKLALKPVPTGNVVVFPTSTVRAVKAAEPELRAQYLLNAAKRLTRALTLDVYPQATRLEAGYQQQYEQAAQNRVRAATALDQVAVSNRGGWLTWRTQEDSRVESECRALAGRRFTLDNLPDGQLPGAVHPHCRCFATPE